MANLNDWKVLRAVPSVGLVTALEYLSGIGSRVGGIAESDRV